ncbi:MAG: hypothetical protein A2X86_07145 [Bdellovibrionales bacterium GWA2_49_15]|nr:MAG: hypothetical protein A2X86_07145 [Bdellovibrionales bacterium GWA2_49_15]HAZ11948.1 hypothetical protein [Bdellovibrionales bacterium]
MKTTLLFIALYLVSTLSLMAQPFVNPLSSFEKINQALARQEITGPDAAGFRVLAFFNDENLPSQLQSDAGAVIATPSDLLLKTAVGLLAQMSPPLAAHVYFYMIPPAYLPAADGNKDVQNFPQPRLIPSQDWAFIENVSSEIRVWYQTDQAEQLLMANQIRALMSDEIIPKEKALMGRTHPRDDLNTRSILVSVGIERAQPNGGDGKLDIYIYNIPAGDDGSAPPKAWVMGYTVDEVSGLGCPARPSYMSVNLAWAKTADPKKFASTLAHEYFHAIQNSYNRKDECEGYNKIDEGTATYIKHHIFPKYNDEHIWWEFSENGRLSLLDEDYETWPFYFFMVQMQGEAVMPKLHETMGSNRAIESVNKVLDGGFKKQWLEYAVYEWNQEPLFDGFRQWDDYNIIPGRGAKDAAGHLPPIKVEKVTLDANGQYRYQMDMELKPLTRDFYAFDVSDANIRTVAIENPVFWNGRKVKVKALVRRKGETKFDELLWEDPQIEQYHYCFDKKNEEIDLIVIVAANFQHLTSGTTYRGQAPFKVSNQGCYAFQGKINSRWELREGSLEHVLDVEASNVKLRAGEFGAEGHFKNQFYLESAVVNYSYRGHMGDCHGFASGFLEAEVGPRSIAMGLASYNVAPEAWADYVIGIPIKDPFFKVTYVCPFPKPPVIGTIAVGLNISSTGVFHKHGFNPRLQGQSSGNGYDVSWDFSPVKE